ncbi:Cation efflux system protein CzcC [Bacteroidales bacterium Barb6XT]|nr:Cation efflux system protein CzcC [Bacteroidales bacterium Barb6XT]
MKTIIPLTALLLLSATATVLSAQTMTYASFMQNVKEKNIQYLAEKYNTDIAKATAEAAKVFPDPDLVLSAADNQERSLQMGYNFNAGLEYTLELGGKRKARIRLAKSEAELTAALVQDYFRNLQADAASAWFTALFQKELVEIKQSSCAQMFALARADSLRFTLGAIMEIDALQSKLEAGTLLNDLIQSEADLQNAVIQLHLLQGSEQLQSTDSLAGKLTFTKRTFLLPDLMETALNNRADLQAALKSAEVSRCNLQLSEANRAIDLGLSAGISYNAEVRNEIAPAPMFRSIGAGISVPLKFSNANKSEIRAGKLAVAQSEAACQAVEQQIRAEVLQAFNQYTAACRQAEQFDTARLTDAETVFRAKRYSYERGETSLLEVLAARRTCNDIRESHSQALLNCLTALVELEKASGIWDIE